MTGWARSPLKSAAAWALPYWTRGEPGRETPSDLFRVLYLGWAVALTLKVLGSSWDVSWHFKWLRDDLAPPHLINTVGTVIVVALTIVHGYTGYGVDRTALRLIQVGTGVFLVAVPLDLINHRVNGLDITSWSPSHMLLYIGTALMIGGVIRGWFVGAPEGRTRTVMLGALFLFCLENTWFPSQHQEYGVFGIHAWDRGEPYAEPILLQFAADQMGRSVDRNMVVAFSLPAPDYLYPVYATAVCMLVLVLARLMIGRAWSATLIAAGYVAYRVLIWPLLMVADFPISAVPFFLLGAAVCVDLAFYIKVPVLRAVVGAALVTAGSYLSLNLQHTLLDSPPLANTSAIAAGGLLLAVWLGGEWFVQRYRLRGQPTGARVSATATP
ncbi:hypothetical protein SAMN05421505_103301 [Sinosporangium album]|uniref:Uncharacterized protein n=2 Tax=Sinosporangium album TaxID=504805 RepID=A0A1G7TL32_9ACTN|nr:hypothetical protein SAMN05421505_103301 [Sinosporangium album]